MKKRIIIIILIIAVILLIVSYPVINDNFYKNNLIKNIEAHTNTDITYLNIYNNYYIVKTKDNIIVYNDKYEEIKKEPLDKILAMNYDIIYKSGSLAYEETLLSKNKITYNYYDIYNGKKIDSIEIEER